MSETNKSGPSPAEIDPSTHAGDILPAFPRGPDGLPVISGGSDDDPARRRGAEILADVEDLAKIAISSLRSVITEGRRARTTEKIADRKESDYVLRSSPTEVRRKRTFSSEVETSDVVPLSITEHLTSHHRQRQVKKLRRAENEKARINTVYGETTPEPARLPTSSSIDAQRWEKNRQTMAKADRGRSHDLGSPEHKTRLFGSSETRRSRMKRRHRVAELSAAASDVSADRKTERTNRRLDKGAEGETVPAVARRALIERAEARKRKLTKRAVMLRQQRRAIFAARRVRKSS